MIADNLKRFAQGVPIRTRLVLAFSTLLSLLLMVSLVALQRFETLTTGMHEFVDQPARFAFLAQRANQYSQYAAIQLLRLLQAPDRDLRIPLYLEMDAAMAASDKAIGGLARAADQAHSQQDIAHVIELRQHYGRLFQETVELIELEGLAQAQAHFAQQTDAALNALLSATLRLADRQRERMDLEVDHFEQSAGAARQVIVAITASALLLGGLLALLIYRSIVMSIRETVAVAETIAEGHYHERIPRGRGPEMRILLRALTQMRENIASRERRITRLAYVDSLTDLPNRAHFMERLAQANERGRGALLLLDIDRFAPINNALGHAVGDRMLYEIASRLRACVASSQLVARLGSDEFAILYEGVDKAASAGHIQMILDALHKPMLLDGQRLDIDVSLGVVFYPDDGDDLTALLRRADLALKAAKRRHDRYAFGAEFEDVVRHEELTMLGDMREALARSEFIIYYQPKMNLVSGRVIGVEALLRWHHPTRGMIAPDLFIPFAEQTGFIREITPWLIQEVITQAARWRCDGIELVASINISALDLLNPLLVRQVTQALERASLPATWLCLEVTESALMEDPELANSHLNMLAQTGVKLSIDDYGAGHASLAYVKTLPVSELKIDRAFVSQVDQLHKNAAIVRSTLLLCHELGISVVAEGVESANELHWLKTNHCDQAQGYYIGRPMTQVALRAWLENHRANSSTPG
ncbi:bifunctional diguanylate cyclase/phosphodiesterase [Pseudomonas aeruginosa]|uniref:putative bifunctional diguanylate cyclase/phosphodiesterase n=1 Tax=Pseudomonas aeruginosa TaxID=287 RepID=UPI0027CC53E4|nr:EAL domain-containing protein [Pseudomonas aeruginosa]MDQ2578880.1 EAL domain-containing protein [Pseudomonas aeruginosa]MDQ2605573.1 EAL domain-containing protein [Pseudomonas aeruginosa]MDT8189525.1 EAL domain-containing protein [Pseudomonas aeruginosa]MDT8211653.1 EAL domain-containing protein [Pseudomonas aeruginosa]HBP6529878.1 EAL domain-containing protein [Pseudomonas aeruginosa]